MSDREIRVIFDADGLNPAFYPSDIYGPFELPVYGEAPASEDGHPQTSPPVIGTEPNPAYPDGTILITSEQWNEFLENQGARRWDGKAVVPYDPPAPPPVAPDGPTLSDWRVALTLWGRLADVTKRVSDLSASSDPSKAVLGKVAQERLEYANWVFKAQLQALKDVLGFTDAEIEESLWRADCVRQGDLSGVWPLPAAASSPA